MNTEGQMAIFCAIISGVLGLFFSLVWHICTGWSLGGVLLSYFLSSQAIFVVLMLAAHGFLVFRGREAPKSAHFRPNLN